MYSSEYLRLTILKSEVANMCHHDANRHLGLMSQRQSFPVTMLIQQVEEEGVVATKKKSQ